jgi:hypothetical protein
MNPAMPALVALVFAMGILRSCTSGLVVRKLGSVCAPWLGWRAEDVDGNILIAEGGSRWSNLNAHSRRAGATVLWRRSF